MTIRSAVRTYRSTTVVSTPSRTMNAALSARCCADTGCTTSDAASAASDALPSAAMIRRDGMDSSDRWARTPASTAVCGPDSERTARTRQRCRRRGVTRPCCCPADGRSFAPMHASPPAHDDLSADLRARLAALIEDGREFFERFDFTVRQHQFHPFIPADYDAVLETLLSLRAPGLRFLEWGSATGVVTIMADLLGFEAYGIELDAELVRVAQALAQKHGSQARFAAGSFLPAGYVWQSSTGDRRLGTIGEGRSGYLELGRPLEDFDIVYAYPWGGEEPVMQDVMKRFAGYGARLVLHGFSHTVHVFRDPRRAP